MDHASPSAIPTRLSHALDALQGAQQRLSQVLRQSNLRLQQQQDRPRFSTALQNSKLGQLQCLGRSLRQHVEGFLQGMAFRAWISSMEARDFTPEALVLRRELRAAQLLLEGMVGRWWLHLQRQKQARHSAAQLRALADAEERRRLRGEGLRQKLTVAEGLLSHRQGRTQKEQRQRRVFAAWARQAEHAFVARSQRAMALEVAAPPATEEQTGRDAELQRAAEILRERSEDLRQSTATLRANFGAMFKGSAILRACWCQWQSWRREHLRYLTQRQEQALLGGYLLPKSKGRQCLSRAWRAWQRLCTGTERPRPVWLHERHLMLITKVTDCLQLLQQYQMWLLRSVMAAWFIFGWLRPQKQRLHHIAAAAIHSDAQLLIAATAQQSLVASSVPATPLPSTPQVQWTPLKRARSQSLLVRWLASREIWAQKALLRAWRFLVAKERAFTAMLELTLEDGETFLASPVKRGAWGAQRGPTSRTKRELIAAGVGSCFCAVYFFNWRFTCAHMCPSKPSMVG